MAGGISSLPEATCKVTSAQKARAGGLTLSPESSPEVTVICHTQAAPASALCFPPPSSPSVITEHLHCGRCCSGTWGPSVTKRDKLLPWGADTPVVSGLIVRGSNCREQSSTDLQDSPTGPISWPYSPIVLELIFATNKTKLLIRMIVIKDIAASLSLDCSLRGEPAVVT